MLRLARTLFAQKYKGYKPYKYKKDIGLGEWMTIGVVVTPSTLVVLNILWNLNQNSYLEKQIDSVCNENEIKRS